MVREYVVTDGQIVRTASQKRCLVVLDRGNGAFVHTRTDSRERAYTDLVRNTGQPGAHGWVVDTVTGETVHEMWRDK